MLPVAKEVYLNQLTLVGQNLQVYQISSLKVVHNISLQRVTEWSFLVKLKAELIMQKQD